MSLSTAQHAARKIGGSDAAMTPAEKAERLHMYELWFRGHNTARIAKRMKLKEHRVYNALSRRLFRNMRAEMHRLRNDLVRAA